MSTEKQTAPSRPPRVLSCVLCQQRKVKCDKIFPCANCVRLRAQCVPATLAPPRRRRRFPKRELLDRLHHYENLLRENSIPFESLYGEESKASSPQTPQDASSKGSASRDDAVVKPKLAYRPKYLCSPNTYAGEVINFIAEISGGL